jgi:hypothetical protein
MIWALLLHGSLFTSCVTYTTDLKYSSTDTPKVEYGITKVFCNSTSGVTIYRLDTPFRVKYVDRKSIDCIKGVYSVKPVQGLPYSLYYSTYKLSDTTYIEEMIDHYINHKAFKDLQSWTIKQTLAEK